MRIIKIGDKKTRIMAILVAVALGATAGLWLWGGGAQAAGYMTAKVERGSLRNTVTATGTLQAVKTVEVGSQVSGTISALYVDFNTTVKKGQLVAQLDPASAEAQLNQARANLNQALASVAQSRASLAQARAGVADASAKVLAARSTTQNQRAGVSSAEANLAVLEAQRDDAQSFYNRQQSLAGKGVISQRDLETAETSLKAADARYRQAEAQLTQARLGEQSASSAGVAQAEAQASQSSAGVSQAEAQVRSAEAQVQQAEAQVEQAELSLSHTTITSPIDGVVVSRNVDVGQTVAASLQAPTLFTIANDLTQMQVIANIDEADIGLVQNAKRATFDVDAFPADDFEGTIQQVRLNPQTTENVVTYNVVIDVANPDQKLKPGMTANLTITIDERDDVLKVPNAALRFTPRSSSSGNWQRGARNANGATDAPAGERAEGRANGPSVAPATAPVLEGQQRRVWVLGPNEKPEPRVVTVGLSDGSATEVTAGELKEGDLVVTGQNLTSDQVGSPSGSRRSSGGFGGPGGFGGSGRGR
jgi:HlyD family secretion protein